MPVRLSRKLLNTNLALLYELHSSLLNAQGTCHSGFLQKHLILFCPSEISPRFKYILI